MVVIKALQLNMFCTCAALLIGPLGGCTRAPAVGSDQRPLRWQLFPGHPTPAFAQARDRITEHLEKTLGLRVRLDQPIDYAEALDHIATGKADLALLNTLGLFVAQQRGELHVRLRVTRAGGRDRHRGQLLVRDAALRRPADLAGKRVAMVDPYSLTGFVLPAILLHERAIEPGALSFVGSHAEALRQLAAGQVDAAAVYVDEGVGPGVPADLWATLPAAASAAAMHAILISDPVPNEPLVVRDGLDPKLASRVLAALRALGRDADLRRALGPLGAIDGFVDASEGDYSALRDRVARATPQLNKQVPGGWKLDVGVAGLLR